jgi:hypothetical protein
MSHYKLTGVLTRDVIASNDGSRMIDWLPAGTEVEVLLLQHPHLGPEILIEAGRSSAVVEGAAVRMTRAEKMYGEDPQVEK